MTHRSLGLILFVLLAQSPLSYSTSHEPVELPLFNAEYKASIKGFSVKASRALTPSDKPEHFTLAFTATSWAASINEMSHISYNTPSIQPLRYDYQQTAFGKQRIRSLTFDYQTDIINSVDNDHTVHIPLKKQPVYDKLSYQLQLQLDLINSKDNLQYLIADKGEMKSYRFELLEEEVITVPAGQLLSQKVKVIRPNKDKVTYIWFARDWQYLLVQLEQYEQDKRKLYIQLNKATVNNTLVTGL